MKLKIGIADDHDIVRQGLKQIISDTDNMVVMGEASNGQELIEMVRKKPFDVLLLDISMPGRSGIEILKQLKIEKPNLPVLMLSMHPEDQYAIRALKAGASGYISKDTASDVLIDAIRKAAEGRKYISPSLAEKLAGTITHDVDEKPHETLSDREFQILVMLARGKSVSDIGRELFLNVKTISTYRRRILDKMNLKNNAELTHYAIENELV
jgi:two-component system, NarL family, invasion response regulator UvrY